LSQSNGADLPLVTVIMPVRNEAAYIERSLGSVLAQEYPADRLEIIVADGMSTDATRSLVDRFRQDHTNIRIVDNPGRIVPTGFNAALRQARGDFIIRVDGHTEIAPDYVRCCVSELLASGADNVGGRMNAQSQGIFGSAVALATGSPFGVGGARFHYSDQKEWGDTVYLGAWPRRVFQSMGMFDEELVRNQDDEFSYRLRANGGRILLSPSIRSTYYSRGTLAGLWRQYFQYGFWKVRILQKHPRQMQVRQFVPPTFIAALLCSVLLVPVTRLGLLLLALIAGSYVVASLAFSIQTAARQGWQHLFLLPVVYAILHVSYGLGFLAGLVRFWNRWGDHRGRVPALPFRDGANTQ